MNPYTVIFTSPGCVQWEFFNCSADDPDHAEEQCENAYPGCSVLWVNEGHNVTTME